MAHRLVSAKKSVESESLPVKLEIIDVEKRRGISKHYAYIIRVSCHDGSHYHIFRRYRQFDEMQRLLEQRFPVESGEFNRSDRILPDLPGKIYFARSAVREVADTRLPQLNNYLQQLFSLGDNIRYDSIVKSFTRQSPQDKQSTYQDSHASNFTRQSPQDKHSTYQDSHASNGNTAAIRSYRPQRPTSLTPSQLKKKPLLPSRPAPPKVLQGPRAKTIYQYTAQHDDELTFPAGVTISLLGQVDHNWYQGKVGGKTGLVPVNYIHILEPPPVKPELKGHYDESDEWDSDDGGEADVSPSHVTYYVRGVAHSMDIGREQVQRPTLYRLKTAIQKSLGRPNFVLNYQDRDGDLVEITNQDDINLMTLEGISPRKPVKKGHAPWTLYITEPGDHTPYNLNPYR